MRGPDVGEPRPHPRQHLVDEIDQVMRQLARTGALSEQSLRRITDVLRRFSRFAAALGDFDGVHDITAELVGAFVDARAADGRPPRIATRHLRRSALRLLFRVARELDLAAGDPTLDLHLPPRSPTIARPLTDEEVGLCRTAALYSLTSSRLAAAWALAETSARTAELPHLRIADLDFDRERIWIHGSPRTEARWGQLSAWGQLQLERRVRELDPAADAQTSLVYSGAGTAESQQASSCQAIGETLQRAGLASEPDIRPVSVAAWAGACSLASTGRIEEVARALGCRSLDTAARMIGHDWRAIEDRRW
jgi:integrase